jgi:dTDP-4-dehydrorhamnose 3,5-epimerase
LQFIQTPLQGAWVIQPDRIEDHRGFFARTFCTQEFAAHALATSFVQCNISFNRQKGTLRGMHYQAAPHEEAKLVRCTAGAVFDAIIDLRPGSPTFKKHFALDLTAGNRTMLYIPEGFAHGFQTLADDTEVFYQMSAFYRAESARGVRWNDSAFGISWPAAERIILDRDAQYPDFAG